MTRAAILSCLLAGAAFAADEKPKPRVAILYFEIASTDPEHAVLSKGLAEMMITDVASDSALIVIERNRLEEVMKELDLNQTSKVDTATAQRIGKILGAQYLVMGTLTAQKNVGTRMLARVVQSETTRVQATASQLVKDGDIFDAEAKLSEQLGAAIAKLDAHDTPAPKKHGSLSIGNAVKYSQALDALDKKDKGAAKAKLQEVVKAQPDFLLASLELDRLMK